jgi:nucleotide-binding universal stress UspA family protein
MQISTILVPLDGSNLAETALPPAVDLAQQHGARLVLLRAVEAHTAPMGDRVQAQVDAVREAEGYVDGVRERVRKAGVTNADTSVWYGPPAVSIVEAARYRGADLIVMSSHGRTGLGRLVLGSVAERVLRGTRVPILLIRPGDAPIDAPLTTSTAKEIAHV